MCTCRFGHVNYEDPHFNVGLPVFTIHGNHDDPAGVVQCEALCLSDLVQIMCLFYHDYMKYRVMIHLIVFKE